MKDKKQLFLVGNAHLDPVWQWRWQEGSAEAKATIRSALDRMKEFPKFRFVCSSASVYQWIEEFDSEMFEEIKERVNEGRFIVVGGWYVQPDCNLPSGEGFARQSLYSQRYFKEKLGVTAKVGYNVDSFGHNLMLPQILKKSGMDYYIFMRPSHTEQPDITSDIFNWVSPDGSSVLAYHIICSYSGNFQELQQISWRIQALNENSRTDLDIAPFFYGVGNHGGGPTIKNLELLEEYQKQHPELSFTYSNLSDFFSAIENSGHPIPDRLDDLQHHAAGCYSTVTSIKNGIRRSEHELLAAESYVVLANKLCNKAFQNAELEKAWKNVCFLHFHDSMDGCSIKEVYDDAQYMYGMSLNTAAVCENNALQTISWAIDTSDKSKGLPVVVFNPHGFEVTHTVQVNKEFNKVSDNNGNTIASQLVHSSTQECYNRKDTLFTATVPALGYNVYYLDNSDQTEYLHFETNTTAIEFNSVRSAKKNEFNSHFDIQTDTKGIILENDFFRIVFELYSGYIISFTDKRTQEELITVRAAVPVVIDEYHQDTWSHDQNYFTDIMARFSDARVTITETGPLRATVKVESKYNSSTLTQYFSLEEGCDRLKVRAFVDWHEKHKMLKIKWPMNVENPKAYYEIPFGVIERPCNGEEEPGLCWTAIKGDNGGFAIINNNTYSSSVKDNIIYHTILRSPIYGDIGGPRDDESDYTNQGRFDFSYELMRVNDNWAPVIQSAKQLNKPLTHILENWHEGKIKNNSYQGIDINRKNVMLSAIKRSEDNSGIVIRLYETDGIKTEFIVRGDLIPIPLNATITPYSVNTYYLDDGSVEWKEVLLTEFDI